MAVAYRDSTGRISAGASVDPTVPATVTAGDTMVLACWYSGSSPTLSTPSGWAAFSGNPYVKGTALQLYLFWRVSDGSEAGNTVTITWSATTAVRNVELWVASGADPTTPILDFSVLIETVSGTTHNAPQVSTQGKAGVYVVEFYSDRGSPSSTNATPTGLTRRDLQAGSGGGSVTSAVADVAAGSNPAGGEQWTGTLTSANAILATILLQPPGGTLAAAAEATGSGAALDTGNTVATGTTEAAGAGTAPFDSAGGTTSLVLTQLNPVDGSGAALDTGNGITFGALEATGAGAAFDTGNAILVNPAEAAGSGAAVQPSVAGGSNPPAGLADSVNAALDAGLAILVNAGLAAGNGAAAPAVTLPLPPAPGLAASLTDVMQAFYLAHNAVGSSLIDLEYAYFSAASGLTGSHTLATHKRSYYRAQLGLTQVQAVARSLTELEWAFWAQVNPANNSGSWSDRARRFYGT